MELLMQTGVSENMAQVVQLLVNEAMRLERGVYLIAATISKEAFQLNIMRSDFGIAMASSIAKSSSTQF